jgi:hypothetical protein
MYMIYKKMKKIYLTSINIINVATKNRFSLFCTNLTSDKRIINFYNSKGKKNMNT